MQKNLFFILVMGFGILCLGVLAGCRLISKSPPDLVLTKSKPSGWAVYSSPVSHEPLVTQIFLKNLETGQTTQLTNTGNNSWPRWSPNGSQLLYTKWTKENSYDIYIMDKDGNHQQPMVATAASENLADWSPDGKQIVFVSNENGKDDIYKIDLASQVISRLTESRGFATLPTWSPDGKHIAFESSAGGPGRSQIFVMNSDGTDVKQITDYNVDNFDGSPVWCPDASCIIFVRYITGISKLIYLDLGNNRTSLLFKDIFDSNMMELRPARSSSRGYITFSAGNSFYTMDMKTGKVYSLGVSGLDLSLYP